MSADSNCCSALEPSCADNRVFEAVATEPAAFVESHVASALSREGRDLLGLNADRPHRCFSSRADLLGSDTLTRVLEGIHAVCSPAPLGYVGQKFRYSTLDAVVGREGPKNLARDCRQKDSSRTSYASAEEPSNELEAVERLGNAHGILTSLVDMTKLSGRVWARLVTSLKDRRWQGQGPSHLRLRRPGRQDYCSNGSTLSCQAITHLPG